MAQVSPKSLRSAALGHRAVAAASIALGLAALAGCELTPNYVNSKDVDDAHIRGNYKTVCVGLKMKDDDVREYATQKLEDITEPISQECICENIVTEDNSWDPSVARGLTGTERDELATCFADLVKRPDLPKRTEAIVALARIPAPSARQVLGEIATTAGDTEQRVQAMGAIAGDTAWHQQMLTVLADDSDAKVRAAAASGLGGFKDDATVQALVKAATEDSDGEVRAAALTTVRKAGVPEADAMACKAMMEDESPEVRKAAIGAFRGTKREEPIKCLRKRAFTVEEDSGVRTTLLSVLKSSPSQDAKDILCDAIPFWMRSYVKEDIPDKLPGTMIVKAQNDRDWERSYECVGKAYRSSSGYSCYAKMHLGLWFRELGGSAYVPKCPGYDGKE